MKGLFPEIGPDTYVQAGHFFHYDGEALFDAKAAIDHAIEILIVEDPNNVMLQRHAEIEADKLLAALNGAGQRLPFADTILDLFGDEGARDGLIETELSRLRSIIDTPGMGVFAVAGAQADVDAFMHAYLQQPGANE